MPHSTVFHVELRVAVAATACFLYEHMRIERLIDRLIIGYYGAHEKEGGTLKYLNHSHKKEKKTKETACSSRVNFACMNFDVAPSATLYTTLATYFSGRALKRQTKEGTQQKRKGVSQKKPLVCHHDPPT